MRLYSSLGLRGDGAKHVPTRASLLINDQITCPLGSSPAGGTASLPGPVHPVDPLALTLAVLRQPGQPQLLLAVLVQHGHLNQGHSIIIQTAFVLSHTIRIYITKLTNQCSEALFFG